MHPYEIICDGSDCNESNDEEPIEPAKKKQKYAIPISKATCEKVDALVGTVLDQGPHEISVNPPLEPGTEEEEDMISRAKACAKLGHLTLYKFQHDAILALLRGIYVILISPTGSGKSAVMYIALEALREKVEFPDGYGVCLQPLNSILREKTSDSNLVKSTYVNYYDWTD